MNPRTLEIYVKGYNIGVKREIEKGNLIAYIQGQYFVEALFATVGNMFSSKNAKPFEYPDKPYELGKTKEELTEEELQAQRDLFVARFMTMQRNFELAHGKGQEQSE